MAEEIAIKYDLHKVRQQAISGGGLIDNSTSVKQFIRLIVIHSPSIEMTKLYRS